MSLSVASSVPLRTPLYWIRGRSCPSVTSRDLVTSATALVGRGPREWEGHACGDANEARTVVKHSSPGQVLPGAWVAALGCGLGPVGWGKAGVLPSPRHSLAPRQPL